MLRAGASSLVKRTLQRSNASAMAPRMSAAFHCSPRREDEEKAPAEVVDKGGFMGTGISELYAIPVGVACAVPILEFNWFIVNEETLLASTFLAFLVVAYTQGGNAIRNALTDEANTMLKMQNEAEDKVIAKLEENLEYMKLTENIVNDYEAVYAMTKESYEMLNAAGKIKPQHDLKAQIEKMLNMIAHEEQMSYDKAKTALMAEATTQVTAQFLDDKILKKAALDNAMAKLTGKGGAGDPVQGAFVKFFQEKAAAAKKTDDGSEEKEARAAMLAKMNAVAENDKMFFRFDPVTGQPKMAA